MQPETSPPETEGAVYRFGVFELNPRLGELRKYGLRVKLQDQPFRILISLLESPGQVVSREQIQAKLWTPDTHVDYENAINGAVRKLREALGDTADSPRFIETLSRRGYRFVAPVSRASIASAAPAPEPPARRSWGRLWAMLLALAVVATSLVYWAIWRRSARIVGLRAPVPITSYPGVECCPTFSPDGSRLAFSWNGPAQDNFDVYALRVGDASPQRLTQDPAIDKFPAWSPDGRSIAFLRALGTHEAAIILLPSRGGAETELARTVVGWQDLDYRAQGPALAWSPDGRFLFTVETVDAGGACGIVRISAETGEKLRVSSPPAGIAGDGAPSVSPDGGMLAFTRTATGLVNGDIYTLGLREDSPAPARKPHRVTFDSKWVLGHAWSADGREIVFSSDRGGRVELWRTRVSGVGRPVRMTGAGEDSGPLRALMQLYLAVSWQGHRLAYTQQTVTGPDIWRVGLSAGEPIGPQRLISSTRGERNAQYSPDGTRIAVHSFRSGRGEIWVCDADGSNPVKVTSFASGQSGTPRWSPDGRRIAFDDSSTGNWEIQVVDAQGGKAIRLTDNPAMDEVPSWSRDGNWVYFGSNRSGRFEVWKTRANGGEAVEVTRSGGFQAFESADGKYLYYTKTDGGSALWRRAVEGGDEKQVLASVFSRNFTATKRRLYFMHQAGPEIELSFLDLASGKTAKVANLGRFLNLGLSVSPDERWALYSKEDTVGSDLMLVEGFR